MPKNATRLCGRRTLLGRSLVCPVMKVLKRTRVSQVVISSRVASSEAELGIEYRTAVDDGTREVPRNLFGQR